MKEHVMNDIEKKVSGGPKSKVHYTYMNPTTRNEFVSVLSKHRKKKIIAEIKEAKYFGIIFDSTPDISRVDQMSQIIRYVSTSNGKAEVKEVYISWIFPTERKKG